MSDGNIISSETRCHSNAVLTAYSDKGPSGKTARMIFSVENSDNIQHQEVRRKENYFPDMLPDLESPALVIKAMSDIRLSQKKLQNTDTGITYDKTKQEYDSFKSASINISIGLENKIAHIREDFQEIIKNETVLSIKNSIRDKLNAKISEMIKLEKEKIVNNLNHFKEVIRNFNGESVFNARIKALEMTAKSFARRLVSGADKDKFIE